MTTLRLLQSSLLFIVGRAQNQAAYRLGTVDTNVCTNGTSDITDMVACKTAASDLKLTWTKGLTNPRKPKKCFVRGNNVYWNYHPTGSPNSACTPICSTAAHPSCDTISGNVSGTVRTFNAVLPPGQHCRCGTDICNPGDIACDANTNACTASRTIPLQLYLSPEFKAAFPTKYKTMAGEVLTEVQRLYELPSLGTKIQLIYKAPIDATTNNIFVDNQNPDRAAGSASLRQMAATNFPEVALVYLSYRSQGATANYGATLKNSMCLNHSRGILVSWREQGRSTAVKGTAITMAHEIAHALGARHDSDYLIMGRHPNATTARTREWSTNTAETIRSNISGLRPSTACLEAPVQLGEDCDQLGRGWRMCDTGLTCDASTSPNKCQVNNAP